MQIPTTLVAGHIHVIRARLDAPPLPVGEFAAVLSTEERQRAARYHRAADAARHEIGRGLLRFALAPHVGAAPEALQFHYTAMGKPYLDEGPSFNVSHAGNVIAIALCTDGRVGIDVEAIRELDDMAALARTAFCADEVNALTNLPPGAQLPSFFRIWARKEALLKALGSGLSALASISVSGAEGSENALLRLEVADESPDRWSVRSIGSPAFIESAVAWDRPVQGVEIVDL